MVLNNSVREILLIQKENNYENNLRSILPDLDMFGIEEICQKNMIKISNKIIELKKIRKKKSDIIVEKEDIHDSDIHDSDTEVLPDSLSDSDSDYGQIKSEQSIINDISYVEPPVNDNELTIISGDIDGSDIDVDEGLDEVEDLGEEYKEDEDVKKMNLGQSFISSTVPGWGEEAKSGGSNMDNMLFSCLERIHKKGGGNNNNNNPRPNLTQNFKTIRSPKENYGGSGANIKKIQLTEKYNFF
jgi:hypothetical protein